MPLQIMFMVTMQEKTLHVRPKNRKDSFVLSYSVSMFTQLDKRDIFFLT